MQDLAHLDKLEAEAIYIIREVAAECEKPVMLYSIGKDSSVLMHLALKAFYPEKPPFPFLHVDTTWKFREMIKFRDETAAKNGIQLLVVQFVLTGLADKSGLRRQTIRIQRTLCIQVQSNHIKLPFLVDLQRDVG